MGAVGTATLDFGAFPGANEASVSVTGQAAIAADSFAEAWFMRDTTGDHTADDHAWAAFFAALSTGNLVAGTGFTIRAVSTEKLTGTFQVRWVWN